MEAEEIKRQISKGKDINTPETKFFHIIGGTSYLSAEGATRA
jgi:hypothetical protein